jgi:formylglycine-generating enzyme required for sulfatase activity
VGGKKPNDLGLFDMHGNVFTWCQESFNDYPTSKSENTYEDKEDDLRIIPTTSRVLRGGSYATRAGVVRSADRYWFVPTDRFNHVGIRAARTFVP